MSTYFEILFTIYLIMNFCHIVWWHRNQAKRDYRELVYFNERETVPWTKKYNALVDTLTVHQKILEELGLVKLSKFNDPHDAEQKEG